MGRKLGVISAALFAAGLLTVHAGLGMQRRADEGQEIVMIPVERNDHIRGRRTVQVRDLEASPLDPTATTLKAGGLLVAQAGLAGLVVRLGELEAEKTKDNE